MGIFSFLRSKKPVSERSHNHNHERRLPLALFPVQEYTAPIHLWAGAIQVLNASESSECRIRKISHCKATLAADRREFLLVFVRHPSGRDAIVRAEKQVQSFPSSLSSLASVHHRNGPPHAHAHAHTHDTVTVGLSYDGTPDCLTRGVSYAELLTLNFPKSPEAPSVAHLAALFVMLNVHRAGGAGTDTSEQLSAWFSYSAVQVLKEIFGGKVKESKGWVNVPYGGMRVDAADRVDALVQRYTRSWDDFSRRLGPAGRTTSLYGGSDPHSASNDKSKVRTERKKGEKRAQMDAFADMLRTMDI
ncbi:hypothetical protein J3A83DRAFT_4115031 [Scleroderma citrinum]